MIYNKTAFKQGRKAYIDGMPKSKNPYPKYDKNELNIPNRSYTSWNDGYEYVKKHNLKESKFEKYLLETKIDVTDKTKWSKIWYDKNYETNAVECAKCKQRFHVENDKIKMNHEFYSECPECKGKSND